MNKMSEQKLYIYIALIFGILFIFLTPPFQSPDEDSHFKKTYQISKGNFYPIVKNNKKGNYFPKDMLSYIKNKLKYIGNRDKKYTYSQMVLDQYLPMNYNNKTFDTYSTNSVIPIIYASPAIGILFSKISAKIFGLEMISTSYMLYFSRLFSLILSIIITYFAIKITPVFKKTFFVVSLIPMSLYLNSMITYDNVLNPLILLTLAIILKISYDKNIEKIPKSYFICLIISGVILLNVKTIYFLIFLLMFTIPVKKFNNKKGMLKAGLLMIGVIIGISVILKIPLFVQKVSLGTNLLVIKRLKFILNNPIKYIVILTKNIFDQRFFQLVSMVSLFGLIDTYVPMLTVFVIYVYIVIIALSEGSTEKIKMSKKIKIASLIFIIISIIGIYSAMYINWAQSSSYNKITGVQGRYFLPLLMPFLLIFSNKKINDNKFFKIVESNYYLIPVIILCSSVFMIFLRYWV